MPRALLVLALLLILPSAAATAKTCTIGKPCGDACIAQDKVCYVGSVGPAIDMRGRSAAVIWVGGAVAVAAVLLAAASLTVWQRSSSVEVQLSPGGGLRFPNLVEFNW